MTAISAVIKPAASWPIGADSPSGATERPVIRLGHLLLLALSLRLVPLAIPAIAHPDEVFQYLETAHRMLFGQGVVTWEWRYGMRGWLVPMVVAGPMAAGAWIAPASALYIILPKFAAVCASLTTVWTAWRLGALIDRSHAVFAAFVAAAWYEFIFFAPHILSDTLSVGCILPAAALLVDRGNRTLRRTALAAALLALAETIRFQNLPAIATLLLATCGRDLRTMWRPLMMGGALGLLPSIIADLAMGVIPFGWLLINIRLNLIENRAAEFGNSGPLGFLPLLWPRWSLWAVPLLAAAVIGARRYPALAWTALANLAFHMTIAHKEYRFIFLSTALAVLLAAIGTVDIVDRVRARKGDEAARERLRFFGIVWMAASVSLAFGGFRSQWTQARPELSAYARLRADPALCGVAAYRLDYSRTGGYAYLHRDVPIDFFSTDELNDPAAALDAYKNEMNAILAQPRYAAELPRDYRQTECWGHDGIAAIRLCLYRRPGTCRSDPNNPFTMSTVIRRHDL